MKRYVFSLAMLALTVCQAAHADGYVPYGRLLMTRTPNAMFVNETNRAATTGETLNAPAMEGKSPGVDAGYPFVDRCGSNGNPCCDGIWSGYVRSCLRQRCAGLYRGCGKCGCDNGYGIARTARPDCNACGCGAAGWGKGFYFGNSFAGGCGGCGSFGLGGFGYACHRLGLHRGFQRGCGCDYGLSMADGCSGCAGKNSSHEMNHSFPNSVISPPVPTPATEAAPEVAPEVAPDTKSALRTYAPRGYMPRTASW